MPANSREDVIWFIGLQAKALYLSAGSLQIARYFASLDLLPAPDQVSPGEYPHLLVLDTMSEPELASQISRLCRAWLTPVLALSPDCEMAERCLLAGAGDVVIAPWTPAELGLRTRHLLRVNLLHADDLTVNLVTREVRLGHERVCLTPLEYGVLVHLMRHAGRVVTCDELLDAVWGYPPEAGDAAQVRNAVRRLRAKLGDDAGAPRHIATVRGVGYRWVAPSDNISERIQNGYGSDTKPG